MTGQEYQMISHDGFRRLLRRNEHAKPKSALGLVSRVTPVQTALRNCTGDEGRPFGFGDQVADPKPPRAAAVKSRGGERRGKAGTMIPAGMVERGERKRTAAEVSKAD
jgi:hypothetical protein